MDGHETAAPSRSGPPATLDLIVLDCPDPWLLARFYAELLGGTVREGYGQGFVILEPSGTDTDGARGRVSLGFQRIEDHRAPTWPGGMHPQQMHLDLLVEDMADATEAAVSAGAVRHPHQPSPDDAFRVFLDPAGRPFCLIR